MSTPAFDYEEEQQSKIPALTLLTTLGYRYIPAKQINRMRTNTSAVILTSVLREYLSQLTFDFANQQHSLSEKAIDSLIANLAPKINQGLTSANELIYNDLIYGVGITEFVNGKKTSPTIPLIDWHNPSNNHFHCTEELTVQNASNNDHCIPDIVCYVNGLPWVVIEAKRPTAKKSGQSTLQQAVSQQIRNQESKHIPHLFAYSQLLLAINGHSGLYGACNTPAKFWATWQEEQFTEQYFAQLKNQPLSPEQFNNIFNHRAAQITADYRALIAGGELTVTDQDRLIISLLSPERLLDMVRYYSIFDQKVGRIVARYQQVFGIKALLERITTFESPQNTEPDARPGARHGGVIWHTTGSGKSFTMVFLTKVLLWLDDLAQCRVVIVTDRIDLESQLSKTFAATGVFSAQNDKLDAMAKSGEHLAKQIGQGNQRVIFTLVNKFGAAINHPHCYNPSENIIVLVDEGHRSQGGENSTHMFNALPKAAFIAFTGTPLLKKDKTENQFGPIIHAYTMQQAVEDKTVTPLLYEERITDLTLNDQAIDAWFERITAALTDKQKTDLKRKFSQKGQIYQTEGRLELIAHDISDHFASFKALGLKGQLACDSKSSAIRYKEQLDKIGKVTSAVVISAPDSREGNEEVDNDSKDIVQRWWKTHVVEGYQQSETAYTKTIIEKFEKQAEPDILIVVDKLLTGFDEPKNTVLYIDKSLKEHNLIQAIARVNRLHDKKRFGYLIDYRGILKELDMTIEKYQQLAERNQNGYDPQDLRDLYKQMATEYKKLPVLYNNLWAVFEGVKNKQDQAALRQFLRPNMVAINDQILDKNLKSRDDFYAALNEYVKCMKVALQSTSFFNDTSFDGPTSRQGSRAHHKLTLKRMLNLRQQVREDADETIDFDEYNDDIRALIDKHVEGIGISEPQATYIVNKLGKSHDGNTANGSDSDSTGTSSNNNKPISDEQARAKTATITNRVTKTIEVTLDDDPYAKAYFSSLLKQAIEETKAMFNAPIKQHLAMQAFEHNTKHRLIPGISELFTNNNGKLNIDAQRYFGLFKLFLDQNQPTRSKIEQDQLVQYAYAIDDIVKTAEAEYSVNPSEIDKQLSRQLIPMLINHFDVPQAQQFIANIIAANNNRQ